MEWAIVTAPAAAAVNLFFELEDPTTHAVINTVGFNDVVPATDVTIPIEMQANPGGGFSRTVGSGLANATPAVATITLALIDSTGNQIATSPLSMAANSQTVIDLSTIVAFTAALPAGDFVGLLTVSSSVPISVISLGDVGPFYSTPAVPGRAAAIGYGTIAIAAGAEQTVFQSTIDGCPDPNSYDYFAPDVPVKAVRLADGTLMLASGNGPTIYASFGPDFNSLRRNCTPVFR